MKFKKKKKKRQKERKRKRREFKEGWGGGEKKRIKQGDFEKVKAKEEKRNIDDR